MSAEERGRSSYLDLLISTLMEHEKNMDGLVEKLEKIAKELSAIYEEASSKAKKEIAKKERGKAAESDLETLVYMRIKLDRPIDETVRIIESLKE
jgi:hypothetical protein